MVPETVVWAGASALLLIVGVVQVAKQAGFPSKYAGILALTLGIVGGAIVGLSDSEIGIIPGIVQGMLAGLGASGAWSTGRGIAQSINGNGA